MIAQSLMDVLPRRFRERADGVTARRMGSLTNAIQVHRQSRIVPLADFEVLMHFVHQERAAFPSIDVPEDFGAWLEQYCTSTKYYFAHVDGRESKCLEAEKKNASKTQASFFLTNADLPNRFRRFPGNGHQLVCQVEYYVQLQLKGDYQIELAKVNLFRWLPQEEPEFQVDLAPICPART